MRCWNGYRSGARCRLSAYALVSDTATQESHNLSASLKSTIVLPFWYRVPAYQGCCVKSDTHTHTRLAALFPGLPGWAGTTKAKPIWILLKQETVSGSGISWNICKSAPRSRQMTMPAPHHWVFFTGLMPFLPPNQQRQSTEGIKHHINACIIKQEHNKAMEHHRLRLWHLCDWEMCQSRDRSDPALPQL